MSIEKIIASLPTRTQAQRDLMGARARDWLSRGTPQQRAEAQGLLDAMKALEIQEAEERRIAPLGTRVGTAFARRPPSETDLKVIGALLAHPGKTSTQLTRSLGWKQEAWHLHFGAMCAARQEWLGEAEAATWGKPFYSGLLADFSAVDKGFTMKPEARGAFVELGIRTA